jgi:hypothetical protein
MSALRIPTEDQNYAPILQSIDLESSGSPIPFYRPSNHSTRGNSDFSRSQVALFLLPAHLFSL